MFVGFHYLVMMAVFAHSTKTNPAEEYAAEFKKYDLNEDGKIDFQELRTVNIGQNLSEKELKEFGDAIDSEQKGFFTLQQYIAYALRQV